MKLLYNRHAESDCTVYGESAQHPIETEDSVGRDAEGGIGRIETAGLDARIVIDCGIKAFEHYAVVGIHHQRIPPWYK